MEVRLIYEDTSGYCHIITPCTNFQYSKEFEDTAIGRLYSRAIPDICEFIVCKPQFIPTDLTFRDAWKKGDCLEPIKIDFQKALQIHRSRIQEACKNKIENLNEDLELALERDDLPSQVAIRKTRKILRSYHDEINLSHCKNPDDIKYSIPIELHDVWNFYNPKRPL